MPAATAWPCRDAAHLLVSGEQMAALEQQLFASGLPVEALMEKAALAVSRRLLSHLDTGAGGSRPQRRDGVLVLVGPGHNGGDGLVVARELHLAGLAVRIWSPFERHKPLTAAHLRHALWLGLPRLEQPPAADDRALWIDALFGIGQHRPVTAALESLLAERQRCRPGGLMAIDSPTGLCADSGQLLGRVAATASHTWCIGLLKQGLVQDCALAWVGRLERIDLGLPQRLLNSLPPAQPLALQAADAATAPRPRPAMAAGKYGRGRLLLVAGSGRYPGAALLAVAGASASGCGSLQAALPAGLAAALWQRQPHLVLVADPGADLAGLAALDLSRHETLLVGPGLGPAIPERREASDSGGAVPSAGELTAWQRLQQFEGLLCLDADGLNRLAEGRAGSGAMTWLQGRRGPTWITPHQGEFRRLFPDLAELPPLAAAAAAARSSGATVLLKGAHTAVAGANGRLWQLIESCPDAARAGLGDVLAGYAAGRGALALAARRQDGSPAIELEGELLAAAALDHARAGLRARRQRGAGGCTPLAVAELLEQAEAEDEAAPNLTPQIFP